MPQKRKTKYHKKGKRNATKKENEMPQKRKINLLNMEFVVNFALINSLI